ncbi:hypothetical protein ALC56_06758 [Trachymyrmex septentrionalis]|uniref:Uncharacterized protein n=1 Tax=Trachymyrmex septentrionalis TaxID=34720 RepID=A0A195FFF9_9HYME|nr:hypothetical protein ALC56_06758 [Trachymyrmex septentrionalis]
MAGKGVSVCAPRANRQLLRGLVFLELPKLPGAIWFSPIAPRAKPHTILKTPPPGEPGYGLVDHDFTPVPSTL